MNDLFDQIETPYIDMQSLFGLMQGYKRPRDCISSLTQSGELIRLKNGFYLIARKIRLGRNALIPPYEQVANMLFGPSYVSLEWALSFYGMIPERVYEVTSMTLGRAKRYQTPVGRFSYVPINAERYCIGIVQKPAVDFVGNFLMATPEKALADLVFARCKKLTKEELRLDLIESKRIDVENFRSLNKSLLAKIGRAYHSQVVHHLVDLVGCL